MFVEQAGEHLEGGTGVRCLWFEDVEGRRVVQHEVFPSSMLELADSPDRSEDRIVRPPSCPRAGPGPPLSRCPLRIKARPVFVARGVGG